MWNPVGKQAILVVVTAQYIAQGPASSLRKPREIWPRGAAAEATLAAAVRGVEILSS